MISKEKLSKIRSKAAKQRTTIIKTCEASNCGNTIKGIITIKHCSNKCKQHCKNERAKTSKILKSVDSDLRKFIARSNNNHTSMSNPLLWASGLGNLEVVKYLSTNGARHSMAIDIARQNKQSDIINYLSSTT